MKKKELNNSEAKKITLEKSKGSAEHLLNELNRSNESEKIQERHKKAIEHSDVHLNNLKKNGQIGEEAEIDKLEDQVHEESKILREMDEIIKNNDKFETIRVIMEILCKELEISKESQMNQIIEALRGVTERYYKSMTDWKNLTKQGQKTSIRQ